MKKMSLLKEVDEQLSALGREHYEQRGKMRQRRDRYSGDESISRMSREEREASSPSRDELQQREELEASVRNNLQKAARMFRQALNAYNRHQQANNLGPLTAQEVIDEDARHDIRR